jgi:hypothetical protein
MEENIKLKEQKKRWYQANKERLNQKQKERNEVNKELIRERKKRYGQENKEKISNFKKEWYLKNKERILENRKEYYESNKEQITKYKKEWHLKNRPKRLLEFKRYNEENQDKIKQQKAIYKSKYPNKNKESSSAYRRKYFDKFKRYSITKYGITIKQYQDLLDKQLHKCYICKIETKKNGRRLCIDHDHINGKVRGLLCNLCNSILGYAKDNIEILQNAIKYLQEPPFQSVDEVK